MADTTKRIFTDDGQKQQKIHDNGDGTVAPAVYVVNPSAGGGGGGATTIADGADVAQGTTTDAEAAAGNGTVIALLKRLRTLLSSILTTLTDGTQKTQVTNLPATQNVAVQNFPATQPVSGTVNVGNIPAEQAVTAADGAIAALGQRVDVEATGNGSLIAITKRLRTLLGDIVTLVTNRLPGALDADGGIKAHVQNLPATQNVAVQNFPAQQSVVVDNLPATQPVSGTVGVNNFPATQAVSVADGSDAALGATTDAEAAAGNGTVVALLKRLRTLLDSQITKLGGGLPAALDADGGLKAHIQNFPASQAITTVDGGSVALGATTDAEAAGNGSLIAIAKRVRTRIDAIITALTDGSQKSRITDGVSDVGISDVGGAKALKVDVVQTVGGGGGGGAVTIADGAAVTIGTTTDAEAAAGNGTVIALLKRIRTLLNGGLAALNSNRHPAVLLNSSGQEPAVTNNLSIGVAGLISGSTRGLMTVAAIAGHDGIGDSWRAVNVNGVLATLLASAARTTTPSVMSMDTPGARGIRLQIAVTAGPNNGSTLTLEVMGRDQGAGQPPLPFASQTIPDGAYASRALFDLVIYPGIDTVVQDDATHIKHYNMPISDRLYFRVLHNGAGSWTYSVVLKALM
jgi:hypothetical protein